MKFRFRPLSGRLRPWKTLENKMSHHLGEAKSRLYKNFGEKMQEV